MAKYFIIGVTNSGGYVARFAIQYDEDGQTHTIASGDFTAGVKRNARLPGDATNIFLTVDDEYFIASWRNIFTKQWDSPPGDSVCFNVAGTTLDPNWAEVPC